MLLSVLHELALENSKFILVVKSGDATLQLICYSKELLPIELFWNSSWADKLGILA